MRFYFLVWQLVLISFNAAAQPPSYPQGYFRNPMGLPMQLSANFGELRPNHWHMGLDIRTDGRENLPVYAAADGYVSHIGIRSQSFGRFIVITHPNGLSTLYAHLNDFNPALEKYVTAEQYSRESWAIELDPAPDQFPVSKGDFIAYSGNTGGSHGPHLHFEIFDTKTTKRLNPLLFGFAFDDNISPALVRLAMYDRSKSVYAQTPRLYALKNTDSGYIIPGTPEIITGLQQVSFALQMYDKSSSGGSPNGVFSAAAYLDDELQSLFMLDSIDYDETEFINAQIDYRFDYKGGAYLQHLAPMPGDEGAAYKRIAGNGIFILDDTLPHLVRIEVKDAHQNSSVLSFSIRRNDSLSALLPVTTAVSALAPAAATEIKKPDFEMLLPATALYDSVPAYYYRENAGGGYAVSARHQVNDPSYPVHGELVVRIQPNRELPADWKNKLVILKSGKGNAARKATWKGEWLQATFGEFGAYQAFADLNPPVIDEPGGRRKKGDDTLDLSASGSIVFSPADNFGLKSFRVELDSQWVRFTNDKSRNWIYKFDERCPYGIHHLRAIAEDLVGNITVKEWWFRRNPYTPPPPKKKKSVKQAGKTKKAGTTKQATKKTTAKKPAAKTVKKKK